MGKVARKMLRIPEKRRRKALVYIMGGEIPNQSVWFLNSMSQEYKASACDTLDAASLFRRDQAHAKAC